MKTRILPTLGAAITAITLQSSAATPYLTPRDAGNQINRASGTAHDPNLVNTTGSVLVYPRGYVASTAMPVANDVRPAAAVCGRMMSGTPRTIQNCSDHPMTMPGCNTATP